MPVSICSTRYIDDTRQCYPQITRELFVFYQLPFYSCIFLHHLPFNDFASLGTELVSTVMDPDLMIAQILFTIFWFLMFLGYFWDVYFLAKDKEFTRIKHYRWNVAIVGSILSTIQVFYWVCHEGKCFPFPFLNSLFIFYSDTKFVHLFQFVFLILVSDN